MVDVPALNDDELFALNYEVSAEVARRRTIAAIPRQVDALNRQFLAASGTQQGEPWRAPAGAHDAYPLGWLVSHLDRDWESLVAGNVWEPPTQWREASGGGCPQWVQPTGATDAYRAGDCVTHEGGAWVSLIDANVWPPGVHGWEPREGAT